MSHCVHDQIYAKFFHLKFNFLRTYRPNLECNLCYKTRYLSFDILVRIEYYFFIHLLKIQRNVPLLCLKLLINLLNMFEIFRHQSVSHLNMSQFVTSLSTGRQQIVFALLPMQVLEKFGKTSWRFVTSLTRMSNLLYKVVLKIFVTNLIMPCHAVTIYQKFNPIVQTAWNKHREHNLLTACQQTTLFTICAFLLMYLYCLFPGSW